MKLIVGLGNPGAKYSGNRHNIGFMAVDRIAQDHGFAPWKTKHQGMVTEGRFGSDRAILLKPETFMNLSGQSVQAAMRFHKLDPSDVIVLHDEIDLAPAKVKFKIGGGHAGHNGLRSIHTPARIMAACALAWVTPVTRTRYLAMCCAISPRRIIAG